jgi:hypothetical protein
MLSKQSTTELQPQIIITFNVLPFLLLSYLFIYLFVGFWDKVSPCSLGQPQPQAHDPHASASSVLGSQTYTTTGNVVLFFFCLFLFGAEDQTEGLMHARGKCSATEPHASSLYYFWKQRIIRPFRTLKRYNLSPKIQFWEHFEKRRDSAIMEEI